MQEKAGDHTIPHLRTKKPKKKWTELKLNINSEAIVSAIGGCSVSPCDVFETNHKSLPEIVGTWTERQTRGELMISSENMRMKEILREEAT